MDQRLRAIFQGGAFVPQVPCELAEGTVVDLVVHIGSPIAPPTILDPVERQAVMDRLVARMKANPIPANSPHFTREELHERR